MWAPGRAPAAWGARGAREGQRRGLRLGAGQSTTLPCRTGPDGRLRSAQGPARGRLGSERHGPGGRRRGGAARRSLRASQHLLPHRPAGQPHGPRSPRQAEGSVSVGTVSPGRAPLRVLVVAEQDVRNTWEPPTPSTAWRHSRRLADSQTSAAQKGGEPGAGVEAKGIRTAMAAVSSCRR